ncbi:enoyl-CoA hydratase [Rhodospirillales bacterium]|nr:enoyl-CoA hydratase [Rhodospirillales bacterium]
MTIQVKDLGSGVVSLKLDRPEKRNALNAELVASLTKSAHDLANNDDLRVVVLEGAGDRVFSAGADINELSSLDPNSARTFITNLYGAIQAVRDIPVPVICKLQGPCIGGAMELAAACDLRVTSTKATFCMPEVRVGIPSVIQAVLLPRLMGKGRADWLVLSGDVIDAQTAYEWNFIEKLVTPKDLDATTDEAVQSILSSAPQAVRTQKELCRGWDDQSTSDAITASIDAFAASYGTSEPADYLAKMTKKP